MMTTPQARRQRTAIAVFVLVAAMVFAVRSEHQSRDLRDLIHRLDADAWQQCHQRALNVAETLNLRSDLVAAEPRLAPIYNRHRLIVPDCGETP